VSTGSQLCYTDAYAQRATGRIVAVVEDSPPFVTLDRTVFYPGGGGQPADRGLLRRPSDGLVWGVTSARKVDG